MIKKSLFARAIIKRKEKQGLETYSLKTKPQNRLYC
jgi:hypothetical protein